MTIDEYLQQSGETPAKLAKDVGVSRQTVWKWRRERRHPVWMDLVMQDKLELRRLRALRDEVMGRLK